MDKRSYQQIERDRVAKAHQDNNDLSKVRIERSLQGIYHVIGLTATGKVIHEKFESRRLAEVFVAALHKRETGGDK